MGDSRTMAPRVPAPAGHPSNAFSAPWRGMPRRRRLALLTAHRVVVGFIRHDGLSWAAAIAFWLVLSLPPLLIALTTIGTALLGADMARDLVADQVAAQLPFGGGLIEQIVDAGLPLFGAASLGSLAFLLFSGSRVFGALARAINAMWSHMESDGILRTLAVRFALLLLVGGLVIASALLQLGLLGATDEIGPLADLLARLVLPTALVVCGLTLTYRLIPGAGPTWSTALTGALIATALLRLAQAAFAFLLATVLEFDQAYGSLAGIAVLMIWAVTACAVVLIGAEVVATLDRHRLPHLPVPTSEPGEPSAR